MASTCLSVTPTSKSLMISTPLSVTASRPPTQSFRCLFGFRSMFRSLRRRNQMPVCRMLPDELRFIRRSPVEFPTEWVTPKSGKRPNIFPKSSRLKIPLPPRLPRDRRVEDEEFDAVDDDPWMNGNRLNIR